MMRKAGELLGALMNTAYLKDRQYAEFIANKIEGSKLGDNAKALGIMGAGSAIGDIRLPQDHGLTGRDLLTNRGIVAGAIASNAGIRYGLPALGAVGLAKGIGGLYDMASNTPVFPQDQTNQLPY
jgi:hypothetical protein